MGEVYCARDTKLGREVAIKVLPSSVANDTDKIARFKREARLLASLNHPYIATLHGLEESNGVHFLVMELIQGQTLSQRIADGPLSIEAALPLFVQIAEALESAHEKGVVHRDLKPANIMITPGGKPKVLDFGLAKAFGPQFSNGAKSESPTISREGTETGVILGTAAYMSPEQARGSALDKRTDVWSFGCCLYEALRGKPPVHGETVSDTIAAILKNEPDLESLPPSTPTGVRRLVARCLRKDSRRRLRDMGDAGLELEEAEKGTVEPTSVAPADAPKINAMARAAIALALLIAGVVLWSLTRSTERPPGEVTRTVITFPTGITLARNTSSPDVAISPDGRSVAFVGTHDDGNQLYLRSLDDRVQRNSSRNGIRPMDRANGGASRNGAVPANAVQRAASHVLPRRPLDCVRVG